MPRTPNDNSPKDQHHNHPRNTLPSSINDYLPRTVNGDIDEHYLPLGALALHPCAHEILPALLVQSAYEIGVARGRLGGKAASPREQETILATLRTQLENHGFHKGDWKTEYIFETLQRAASRRFRDDPVRSR